LDSRTGDAGPELVVLGARELAEKLAGPLFSGGTVRATFASPTCWMMRKQPLGRGLRYLVPPALESVQSGSFQKLYLEHTAWHAPGCTCVLDKIIPRREDGGFGLHVGSTLLDHTPRLAASAKLGLPAGGILWKVMHDYAMGTSTSPLFKCLGGPAGGWR
jgi:hypothetical protein